MSMYKYRYYIHFEYAKNSDRIIRVKIVYTWPRFLPKKFHGNYYKLLYLLSCIQCRTIVIAVLHSLPF